MFTGSGPTYPMMRSTTSSEGTEQDRPSKSGKGVENSGGLSALKLLVDCAEETAAYNASTR